MIRYWICGVCLCSALAVPSIKEVDRGEQLIREMQEGFERFDRLIRLHEATTIAIERTQAYMRERMLDMCQ